MYPTDKKKLGLDMLGQPGAQAPVGAGDLMGGSTDQLSNQDLMGMQQGVGMQQDPSSDPLQLQELQRILDDPTTPPDVRAEIQAKLAQAARRRLQGAAGVPMAG